MLASDINNLTFFPKGTILTFSSTAWGATTAEFKNIWKVCNAANHVADPNNVPDLTDKFLRGAESSDFTTALGADSQSVTLTSANLPEHKHEVKALPLSNLNTGGLSISESGGHKHEGSGSTNTGSGGHRHDVSGSTDSKSLTGSWGEDRNTVADGIIAKGDNLSGVSAAGSGGGVRLKIDASHDHPFSCTTSENGGIHDHEVRITTTDGGGLHSHTISGSITGGSVSGNTENAGVVSSALTFSTVPAYYKVIYIIKVV
jgi:hypothetical protein